MATSKDTTKPDDVESEQKGRETLHVRIDDDLLDELTAHENELRGSMPGMRVTRSDAARSLIRQAIKERQRNRGRAR